MDPGGGNHSCHSHTRSNYYKIRPALENFMGGGVGFSRLEAKQVSSKEFSRQTALLSLRNQLERLLQLSFWELGAVSSNLYSQSIPLTLKQAKSIRDSRPQFPQYGLWTMTTIINRPQELVTKIVPSLIPTLLCQNSHFPKHCQATTICKAPIGTHGSP